MVLTDIYGNYDALSALPETCDQPWVLGDPVNCGPEPGPVIDFVKSKASIVVRGNHDHSIGYNENPRCSPRFQEMAEATRRYTDSVLTFGHKHYLRNLPLYVQTQEG